MTAVINEARFLAQIINFILLMALLYRLLYQPVKTFMDKRTAEIEQQISSAQEDQLAARALRLELEKQANESRQQSRLFLDEASKKAAELQGEMLEAAREEAKAIILRANEVNRLEKEKAWAELKTEVGELSLLLASKIIQESLDQNQHQYLIDQALAELENTGKESSNEH